MRNGRFNWTREQAIRVIGCGIRGFLAAALTASRLSDGSAPFALGCVGASGAGAEGVSALLGAGLGTLLFLDFSAGLPQLAAGVLIVTAATAFRGLRILERPWFSPCLTGLLLLAVRLAALLQSPDPLGELFPCLTAVGLAGVSAWYYGKLLPERESLHPDALVFLAVTLLLALTDVEAGDVSVGRTLIVCVVLLTAYSRGAAAGTAVGVCAGLGVDLFGDGGLFFAAAYGFAGLLAGSRSGRGRVGAAGFWMMGVVMLLVPVTDGRGAPLLFESLLALPVFLLLPARILGGKRLRRPEETVSAAPVLDGLRERLTRAAAAFRDLYDSCGRGSVRAAEENPAVIFDRAAERVCRGCGLCDLCWQREYTTTFNALNDATPFLLERGRVLAKDFPRHFSDRCIHLPEFLQAVNTELSSFLLRQEYRRQLEETRRSACGQYAQLSDLLSATAAGLGASARPAFAAGAAYRIGAALRPRQGESVCGDSVGSFETGDGLLCLLLSDGMGSGEEARRESALTNRLLRQFLEAGIEAEAALKTLNSAMALRSAETGSFSTIDLLTVRPRNGEAALYKYGAAPSYLKRNGAVRRITGASLPAGLRSDAPSPDVTRLTLERGSFLVLISDGVADADHDDWLQDLLAGWEGADPQILAGLVLSEAARRGQVEDDCGVQVLYLPPDGSKSV